MEPMSSITSGDNDDVDDSISPSFYNPIVLYFPPSNYASSYNYLLYICLFQYIESFSKKKL